MTDTAVLSTIGSIRKSESLSSGQIYRHSDPFYPAFIITIETSLVKNDPAQSLIEVGRHGSELEAQAGDASTYITSFIKGQNKVLEQIAQGEPLSTVLETLALVIEASTEVTTYCSFLLFDAAAQRLRHGAAPSLPTAYCELIDGVMIGPNVGSCGTAAYYTASVIVEDIDTDPLWNDYRALAQRHNLRACWSTPILANRQILATFAMYHPFPYRPTVRDRELLEKATYLARIAIERHQAEVALKQANDSLEQQVAERTQALQATLEELQRTQHQMIQSEKMSSLGRMVAGVAHEINNPVSFIYGNLSYLNQEIPNVLAALEAYEQQYPEAEPDLQKTLGDLDVPFLKEDLPKLLKSMSVGTERIREIVLSLRNFSRIDEADCKRVNIHEGIDSTLLILQHKLWANAQRAEIPVLKDYGDLPLVECYAGALNQVFMNIVSNAIDAIDMAIERSDAPSQADYRITIQTSQIDQDWIKVAIADNGIGMTPQTQKQIFDPFFTTKTIGKGTGMGMSISYQVITEQHQGRIDCRSVLHQGTEFSIHIPIRQMTS